jgi:6-phosphogluconolactonase (cycloisomerase 2 family)
LALDEARHRLFVVNEIEEFEGLPTGSVESYAVSLKTGRIELLSRRGLSLSATRPKQLAVSPDGAFLVVAVYGGGAFNVLPILADGTFGPVTQVLKEIGCGPDPTEQKASHPYAVAFHPSGRFVFASDLGSDRLSVFSFDGGRLERLHERKTPAGSGPAEISLDSNGFELSVEHRLKRFRSRYYFDAQSGELRQFDTEA